MSNAFNGKEPHMVIENIDLSFGGIKCITDISFTVYKGEICAVIGPNGAGKSSMLNVINGVYIPQKGSITFEGKKFEKMKPHSAAVMGIARTFQNIALFSGMSVVENIMTGRNLMMKSTFIENALGIGRNKKEELQHREACEEIIDFLGLQAIRKTPVSALSYGLQKRVELGRALAAEPNMLLMDEPIAGMNLEEKLDMACFIQEINRNRSTTIVLIEHDMGVVMDISDHVVVMDYGAKIGDGTPDEVINNQAVVDAYLGVSHDD